MWFYTGHTFLLLWMGATVLDAPFSQLLFIKRCCYDQRKYCFRSTKSLICSVDYSVHPYAGCAINTQLQCKGFSNWILAFIDIRVEPPPAIAPPPQWAAPSFMVNVNPRSPLCDLQLRVRHQKHLFDFQLFLLWSRITTKSPGLTSCRNLSATFPWAAFTCTEIFDNRQDTSLQ